MHTRLTYEGETKIEGNRIGSFCILRAEESLKRYKNRKMHYKVILTDDDPVRHNINYIGFKKDRHFFEVTSGDSGEKYMVDISFGCDCRHSSIKGIPLGIPCKHIRLALSKFLK